MKTKSILTALVLLFMVTCNAMASNLSEPKGEESLELNGPYTIIITGNGVIGRDGPAGYDTGVRFNKGQVLTCYGMDGSWYKVKYGNGVRWVSSSYAKPYTGKTATAQPVVTNYVVITGDRVIGRKSPAGADSGTRFYKGARLPYLGMQGSWYKVKYKGKILWVSDQYGYVE
ncbi:MAG: hypothetical protein J5529_04810 [Prevotella sp.]|jgi:hypothetical protein|nr:hypothetical protein [Prevotella sp.]